MQISTLKAGSWRRSKKAKPDQIVARVAFENSWAPGTVKTLVTRLLRKKAIAGSKDGPQVAYRPLIERSAWVQPKAAPSR